MKSLLEAKMKDVEVNYAGLHYKRTLKDVRSWGNQQLLKQYF